MPDEIISDEMRKRLEIVAVIDRWHSDLFVASGVTTDLWNRSVQAREDLKIKICKILGEGKTQ